MSSELISPNLHVVLIHYPLAMLIIGTLIETFAFIWPASSFRTAGRWMILLGAMFAIPATFSGIYAFRQIANVSGDAHWIDVRSSSAVLSQPAVWNMLRRHIWYQSIATGVASLVVVIWLGATDHLRRSLHVLLVVLLLGTVGLMMYGAWFGGESIYRKGVAVTVESTAQTQPAAVPLSMWASGPTQAELMFPPVELHTIMAGLAVAIAVLSIGLSMRKISDFQEPVEEPIVTTGPPGERYLRFSTGKSNDEDMVRTFNPAITSLPPPFVPAGRFWMLAFFLALLTALGGIFVLARDADILTAMVNAPRQIPKLIWDQIKPEAPAKINRLLGHAVSGSAIVALPILLALASRLAPRKKWLLSFFTLLLVCAVAAQVWLGILLLLDTPAGPVTRFNLSTDVAAS